jgi:ribosome maturation factor RimP
MNFEIAKDKIEAWLKPVMEEKNLFLVDVKISAGRRIEVYIDSDTGIHIDDCASVSRFLEKHLDGSGMVPPNYILEVSSPGMSNPLKVPRQYKKRLGRVLEVLTNSGATITGSLMEADEEKIKLQEVKEDEKGKKNKKNGASINTPEQVAKEYVLRYDEIKRAMLQFKF